MLLHEMLKLYDKGLRVIDSCLTMDQLESAQRFVGIIRDRLRECKNSQFAKDASAELLHRLIEKRIQLIASLPAEVIPSETSRLKLLGGTWVGGGGWAGAGGGGSR